MLCASHEETAENDETCPYCELQYRATLQTVFDAGMSVLEKMTSVEFLATDVVNARNSGLDELFAAIDKLEAALKELEVELSALDTLSDLPVKVSE